MSDRGFYEINRWSAGALDLPLMAMPGNMWRVTRHWQDGIEILMPLRGSLTVEIEDRSFQIEPGGVITIDAGLSHECFSQEEGAIQLIFNIPDSLLRREPGQIVWLTSSGMDSVPPGHPDVVMLRSAIFELAEICGRYWRDGFGDYPGMTASNEDWYQARCLLDRVLLLLSRHLTGKTMFEHVRVSQKFQQCLSVVHRDYAQPIDAKTIGERLGYSESTVYRLFRQYTGSSFNDYLTAVRLNAACGMLRTEDNNVLEVLLNCGFQSVSTFYRLFSAHFGISPVEYQKAAASHSQNLLEQDEMRKYNLWRSFEQLGCTWENLGQLCEQLGK